jgi:hypothetical protein
MSYGHYNPSSDTWTFTCAGCGKEFQESDCISPLDGLDCCSAECDESVEANFARMLAADPAWKAELEAEGLI